MQPKPERERFVVRAVRGGREKPDKSCDGVGVALPVQAQQCLGLLFQMIGMGLGRQLFMRILVQ